MDNASRSFLCERRRSRRTLRAIARAALKLTPVRHHDREGDDRYGTKPEHGDVEGLGTHLKQPGIPAGQYDTFHGSDAKRCADQQAAQPPGRFAKEAHHQPSDYSNHHDQQRPLAQ